MNLGTTDPNEALLPKINIKLILNITYNSIVSSSIQQWQKTSLHENNSKISQWDLDQAYLWVNIIILYYYNIEQLPEVVH